LFLLMSISIEKESKFDYLSIIHDICHRNYALSIVQHSNLTTDNLVGLFLFRKHRSMSSDNYRHMRLDRREKSK
jgi:hypothetical protein